MPESRGSAKPLTTHTCPRCGYDQAGEIARWETAEPPACPLIGLCTECGLDFQWCMVMRPELRVPRWFVETADVSRRLMTAVWTGSRSIVPWNFWRRVRMEYPVLIPRAALVAALIAIGCYFLMVATCVVIDSWKVTPLSNRLVMLVTEPLSDEALLPYAADYEMEVQMRRWGALVNRVQVPMSIGSLISAADAVVLLASIFMPLTFRLLPVTLQRCRVRREHLARIALYSAPWLLLCAGPLMRVAGASLLKINWLFGARGPGFDLYWVAGMFDDRTATMVVPICSLWLFVAWGFACSRYLRLPTAWAVACALMVISVLSATLLVLLAYPMAYKHLFSGLV